MSKEKRVRPPLARSDSTGGRQNTKNLPGRVARLLLNSATRRSPESLPKMGQALPVDVPPSLPSSSNCRALACRLRRWGGREDGAEEGRRHGNVRDSWAYLLGLPFCMVPGRCEVELAAALPGPRLGYEIDDKLCQKPVGGLQDSAEAAPRPRRLQSVAPYVLTQVACHHISYLAEIHSCSASIHECSGKPSALPSR